MQLLIVESPAKSKTIEKYLGKDFKVLASYGHIRDLPSKNGSVEPDDDFNMKWEVTPNSARSLGQIEQSAKKAKALYLATDPDREGEAIAWHVFEMLKDKIKDIPVQRIVFHEITKTAVQHALANPRPLNQNLIDAYLARRALDYLVGFSLSPILWRKLPGSRSAGRVQSVALRLIVEQEHAIEKFITQEYWTVHVDLKTSKDKIFTAQLTYINGEKLDKFSIGTNDAAAQIVSILESQDFKVTTIEKKKVSRNPSPPFSTSTLQQDAARKLGFGAKKTMQVAQRLYEGIDMGGGETVGIITYMRTDSIHMGKEAVENCRKYIQTQFGDPYLPPSPPVYKNKVKNAQEAHEAIRPTDFHLSPESLSQHLDKDLLNLYTLVWKRATSSQMTSALFDQVGVDINSERSQLRATGSTLVFDGFLKLYEEGKDDDEGEDGPKRLPALHVDEPLGREKITPAQHFTQPPPRYTEATLVKKLEELGIGRPSTYASIIQVLQDRKYVKLDKKRFFPEEKGMLVATFLEHYFKKYVEYDFTAHLEEELDEISRGQLEWKNVLSEFWTAFDKKIQDAKDLKISDVLDVLEADLASHLFRTPTGEVIDRACPTCKEGTLNLKLGRYGVFLGCNRYPDCRYIYNLGDEMPQEPTDLEYPKILGSDPTTQEEITLRKGPYGFYVQKGEPKGKEKPRRSSLGKEVLPESMTLEQALTMLALPRILGLHPETKEEISADIGRYGPYIKWGKGFYSFKKGDIQTLTLEDAIDFLKTQKKKEGTHKSKA